MRPETESQLCEIIREADLPLRIRGGGSRTLGPAHEAVSGPVLETGGMRGITLYEPGALTLVARAGTPLEEVEATLARENQRLAFEPMRLGGLLGRKGASSIGGVVAANASGPRRIQAGACRDSLIGVRLVDGRGAVVRNGGRVMKNVTGYDLVKLMAGSHGTLGVLTEVSFKVLPGVEACACLSLSGLGTGSAVRAMSAALGSPFEVTGAAHDPQAGLTLLRLEGFAASVSYRAGALAQLLAPFGAVSVERDPQAVAAIWRGIAEVAALQGCPGDIWRISVAPGDAPEVARALKDARLLFDWGGGLIWAAVPAGTDLRARLRVPGHATLMRGRGQPVFHPEPEALARLARGLRENFDPRGILNRGMMG